MMTPDTRDTRDILIALEQKVADLCRAIEKRDKQIDSRCDQEGVLMAGHEKKIGLLMLDVHGLKTLIYRVAWIAPTLIGAGFGLGKAL